MKRGPALVLLLAMAAAPSAAIQEESKSRPAAAGLRSAITAHAPSRAVRDLGPSHRRRSMQAGSPRLRYIP
jgi:hypothetical protein